MDNVAVSYRGRLGACISGALFVVAIGWLAKPRPVQAYSYFTTKACTATYFGAWNKKMPDGQLVPFDAADYGTDCTTRGTSYIKPTMFISSPNNDVLYGGTFTVTGTAQYNICFNSANSYSVSVTVTDDLGNSVTKTDPPPPTPPLTAQEIQLQYNRREISYWEYVELMSQAQNGGRGGILANQRIVQPQGLSQGSVFSVGPFGPYTDTARTYTVKITTTISSPWGSFLHEGEMRVGVQSPSPTIPLISVDNPSLQWEVGGSYTVYADSKAYPTATDISLEVRDDTPNSVSHFNVVTSGTSPFPSGASPSEKSLKYPFIYAPPTGGLASLSARACNSVNRVKYCSAWSYPFSKTVIDKPGAPSNLNAFGANSTVLLTWGAPSGGASVATYRVYRALSSGALSVAILDAVNAASSARACTKSSTTPCMVGDRATAATSTDPMQDTEVSNGTAYYYVVRAQSAGGAYSPPSPEATATPGATSKAYNVDVVIDPKELTKGEYNDTLSVSALGTSGDVEIPVDVIVTKRQPPNPNVYGWAWGGGYAKDGGEESDTLGWISLNCTNEGTCETGSATTGGGKNYGVKIEDYTDGPYKGKRAKLSGFAWAGGKEQVAENPTGPNDYQDSTSNGWICFGESCPGTAPGVVEKSGAGVATVEAAGPSDAWINIDTTSAEEWGTVHGWAKVLNLGNDGWVRLGGRSKHSSGAFEQFPLRLSKDPDVSHTDVAGKSYRTFEGHAWGNGRVAPGNADEQDCQSDPQCVNPVGWIDFSCENNSFGVTCAELHGKKIPGINDKQDPTTNKAGWPKCSNNFTNQPYADCFTVGTDYVPPLANLYASNIKLVNVDDPSNPSEFPVQMVTNDKGVSTEVINVVQDQKIQFIARLANIGGSDIPGNKHWDNAFYDLEVNDRVTADATDGHVSIKKVRKSDDTPWNRGEVKEIITDQNDPFTFPSTVLGCARDVYTCRHYIWFKADINNEIPEELSKTDNVIGPVIVNVVANKPDLEIVEMVPLADPLTSLPPTSALDANLSPLSRQYYSDTFTMLVGVKNTGLKPAVMAGLPVAIYRRSKPKSGSLPALALGAADPVATAVLPSNAPELAVGATYYTQITIVAKDLGSPAEYVLTGYVDNRGDTPPGTGFLPEMDETNNQSNTCGRGTAATTPCVFTVAIDPPDLTITSMSVSKTKVKPGGIVKIIAKVKNKGDSALSSTTSTGNVVTGLYMLAPGDTSALPIPITKDDYASKNVGAFTTRFRDLAAGAEIDVEALNDTDPGDATIKGYKMPTAVGTYTFCAFVDVLDTVYEGRLGGERNNGSGSAKFPDCKTVEVQNLPLAVTSCQATYEGNHQAQVRWTAPARSASAPVNGYVIQRWKSQTQSLDVEFARTTDPLAPGLNVARTNYIDNSGTNGPNPFVCQPQPDGYEYRVVSINEVGETSTTCSGVVNCNSLAYLEYNIKSSFPKDLSIRVGRAVHKPDPKGDPAFGDVLPDIDHYEEFNPATGCTYTGDSVDVPSLEGECADKFTPASTTSSTHATGRYSSAGSSINLDRFFGNLSPSFPSNQWYMKVRDNRQQEVVDVPPLDTGLPTIPPKPPVVTPIVSNVSPVLSTTSVNGVKLAPRPTLRMSGGKKFIAYSGNSGLYLQMCTNVDCTTTVSTLIDANEKSWSPPDFQFIGDKIILAYTDRHSTLWLAMCDVATSTDPCPNLQKKYIGYSYGENLALQIDNGKPVIAYGFSNRGDFGDFKLRLLRCGAPTATDPCPDPIEKSFSDRAYAISLRLNEGKVYVSYINWGRITDVNKIKLLVCDVASATDACPNAVSEVVAQGQYNTYAPTFQIIGGKTILAYGEQYSPDRWTYKERTMMIQCDAPTASTVCPNKISKVFNDYNTEDAGLQMNVLNGKPAILYNGPGLRFALCSGATATDPCLTPTTVQLDKGVSKDTSLQINDNSIVVAYARGANIKMVRVQNLQRSDQKLNITWGPLYSVELNPDGTPSIVFSKDKYNKNIVHCTSSSCLAPSVKRMSPDNVAAWREMSYQPNGDTPMFSFYNYPGNSSWSSTIGVARCKDRSCKEVETKEKITPGWQSSLQLNAGKAVVAFMGNEGQLKLLRCGMPVDGDPCPDPVVKVIDAGTRDPERVGGVTLKLNNGLPVIGFTAGFNGQLKLILCDDEECSTHITKEIDSPGTGRPDIAFNSGKPILAFEHLHQLRLAFCSNAACSDVVYKKGPSASPSMDYPSLQLDSAGRPMVGYVEGWVGRTFTSSPMLAWCSNATDCGVMATQKISTTQEVLSKVIVRMVDNDPFIVYDIEQNDDNYLGIVNGIFSVTPKPWMGTNRPRAGEEFASDNPTFSWVYDAQGRTNPQNGWRIQVSTDPNFSSSVTPAIDETCTPTATKKCDQTSFQQSLATTKVKGEFSIAAATPSALVRGQRYYWRVMVQDTLGTLGTGAWSGAQAFSIAATPPGDEHEILSAKIVKVGSSKPETLACAVDPTIPNSSFKPVDPANHNTVKFADLQEGYVYFSCEADDNQQIEVIPNPNDLTSGEVHIKPGKPAKKVRINVSTMSGRPQPGGRRMNVELSDNFPAAPAGEQKKIKYKIRLAEPDRGRGDHNGNEHNDSKVSFDSTRRAPSISDIEIELGAALDALPGRYNLTVSVTSDGPATTKIIPVVVEELLPSALCIKPIQPKASARNDQTVGCVLINPADSGGRCTTPSIVLRCNSGSDTSWGTCVACFLGTVQEGKQNQSLNYTATAPAGSAQRVGLINPGGKDVDFTLRGRGSQGTGTDTRFQLYKEVTPESGNMTPVPFGSFTGVATARDPQFDVSIPPHVPALDPSTGSYPQQIFEVIPQNVSDPVNSAQVYYQYFVNRAPVATPQYPILGDQSRQERKQGSNNATDCENVAGLHDYHPIYNAAFGYDSCNKDDRAYDASNPLKPKLAWKFEDPDAASPNDADKQTKYQLEVRDLNGTLMWAKGPTATDGPTSGNEVVVQYAGTTALAWNTSYKWRVKVWDNNGGDSGDLSSAPWVTFVTPRHPDPIADFTYSPKIVLANTEIHFTNNSLCYDDGAANQVPTSCPDPRYSTPVPPAKPQLIKPGATYFWIFGKPDGTPLQFSSSQMSTLKNPTYQFLEGGDQTVTLTVIDQTGYTSSPRTTTLGDPNARPTSTVPQIDCKATTNWCVTTDPATDPTNPTNRSCKQECIGVQTIEFRRRAP